MKKFKLLLLLLLPLLVLVSCNVTNPIVGPSITNPLNPTKTTKEEPTTTTKEATPTTSLDPSLTTTEPATTTTEEHTHTFESKWSYNTKYHYHASTCGHDVVKDQAEHTFTNETKEDKIISTCSVCGYSVEYSTSISLNDLYGYNYFKNLDTKYSDFYEQLFITAQEFDESNTDVSQTLEVSGNNYYYIKSLKFGDTLTQAEATSVWNVFLIENPEFYWLSNNILTDSSGNLNLAIGDDYINHTRRAAINTKLDNLVTDVTNELKGASTDLEKLMTIHQYIIGKIDYAYEADGVTPEDDLWAHNIVGFVENKKGVCECYAKTFLYLSHHFGLENIPLTGTSKGQGHMWNLAMVDDSWYHFDFTWDDQSKGISYSYFGLSASDIAFDHVLHNQTLGITYLYTLPTVSDNTINLVKIYEKGEEKNIQLGYANSLDEAFTGLEENKDYIFELTNYFNRLDKENDVIDNKAYKLSSITNKVKSLEIRGMANIGNNGSYYSPTIINLATDVTLSFDVTFENVELKSNIYKLTIKDSKTTFVGYDKINVEILDSNGSIDNASSDVINYNKPLTITNMTASVGGGRICATAKITNFYIENNKRTDLYLTNPNIKIEITNLITVKCTSGENIPTLLLNSTALNTGLQIDNILADESSTFKYVYFNVVARDGESYPTIEIKSTTLDIYYIIISENVTSSTMSGRNIIKSSTNIISKFNLFFIKNNSSPIPVDSSDLEYVDGYIKIK